MAEWHLTTEELPPIYTPVEAIWADGNEPTKLMFHSVNHWFDFDSGYGVPTPLKWREVRE